jgi:RHS repeat-associated protein
VFTTYQHNPETGLEYALARYYDPRTAAFCSADPVEGDPNDPESWNRYPYARDNPISITDPSGQFWLWDVFKIAGIIAADYFSANLANFAFEAGGLSFTSGLDLSASLASAAETAHMIQQGQREQQAQEQQTPQLPPALRIPQNPPDTYIKCAPVPFIITGVGPHQAPGGAAGFPPANETAAYHPQDFGLSNGEAKQIDRSTSPIFFQPDWSQAQITGRNGGIVQPAPNRGMPQIPSGLPTQGTIAGSDTVYPPVSHHIDVYRYPTDAQANAATRIVPTTVYLPRGVGGKCPKAQ